MPDWVALTIILEEDVSEGFMAMQSSSTVIANVTRSVERHMGGFDEDAMAVYFRRNGQKLFAKAASLLQ